MTLHQQFACIVLNYSCWFRRTVSRKIHRYRVIRSTMAACFVYRQLKQTKNSRQIKRKCRLNKESVFYFYQIYYYYRLIVARADFCSFPLQWGLEWLLLRFTNCLIIVKRNNLFLGGFGCQYLLPTSYTTFVDSVLAST